MYAEYFGPREPPFNITPDPRFLSLNDCYQEALAALGYGIEARKGFISLIGDAGTGKTTLLRRLLDTVGPATKTVLLLNPTVSFDEILEHILLELGVPPEGGRKLVLLQRLNEFLLEHTQAGGNVALLIDEAQDLRPDVLEELRLLSNLETAREKILQIVLAGQPELDATLADPSLRQLRQRVTLRIRLRPLSQPEVAAYVRARVERVGGTRADPPHCRREEPRRDPRAPPAVPGCGPHGRAAPPHGGRRPPAPARPHARPRHGPPPRRPPPRQHFCPPDQPRVGEPEGGGHA